MLPSLVAASPRPIIEPLPPFTMAHPPLYRAFLAGDLAPHLDPFTHTNSAIVW
jgi:hypothetical protein